MFQPRLRSWGVLGSFAEHEDTRPSVRGRRDVGGAGSSVLAAHAVAVAVETMRVRWEDGEVSVGYFTAVEVWWWWRYAAVRVGRVAGAGS